MKGIASPIFISTSTWYVTLIIDDLQDICIHVYVTEAVVVSPSYVCTTASSCQTETESLGPTARVRLRGEQYVRVCLVLPCSQLELQPVM